MASAMAVIPAFAHTSLASAPAANTFGCERIALIDSPVCGAIADVAVPAAAATSKRKKIEKT